MATTCKHAIDVENGHRCFECEREAGRPHKPDPILMKNAAFLGAIRNAANFYAYHWYTDGSDKLGDCIIDKAMSDYEKANGR